MINAADLPKMDPLLLTQNLDSPLLKTPLEGPVVTLTSFKNLEEIENLTDFMEGYKRISVFSKSDSDVKKVVESISFNRLNVNGFEDCSIKRELNNMDMFHPMKKFTSQTIL